MLTGKITSKRSVILTWLKHHLVVLPVQALVSRALNVASEASLLNVPDVEQKTQECDDWCTTNFSPYADCDCK